MNEGRRRDSEILRTVSKSAEIWRRARTHVGEMLKLLAFYGFEPKSLRLLAFKASLCARTR